MEALSIHEVVAYDDLTGGRRASTVESYPHTEGGMPHCTCAPLHPVLSGRLAGDTRQVASSCDYCKSLPTVVSDEPISAVPYTLFNIYSATASHVYYHWLNFVSYGIIRCIVLVQG